MNCDPDFGLLLEDFFSERLLTSEDTIYGLWPDLTLAYFNEGWTQFASRNGGEPEISLNWKLGRNIEEAIPEVLRPFFKSGFDQCLAENQPWEHSYECSSGETYRCFMLRAYPLKGSRGILVVNSPICSGTHVSEAKSPDENNYRNSDGFIVQCCHCRRVRRPGIKKAWDFIPEWIAKFPPNTSHGLCEPCFGFFYGNSGLEG